MIKLIYKILIICAILQPGYFQENYIYQPNSATGQYGGYKWPFQIQAMNGNYNPSSRRHKKPCTRRMNPNDPNSEVIQPEWVPTYTSRVVKPLEQNNVLFKSRSLKDKDFNSKSSTTTEKVVEISTTTEKFLAQPDFKESLARNGDNCATTTTTEEVASRSHTDNGQVGPNYDYYDEVEDNNEVHEYEYDDRSDESPEVDSEDCNNILEPDGNPRRFLSSPVAFDGDQTANDINNTNNLLNRNYNGIPPNLLDDKEFIDSEKRVRSGYANLNASVPKLNGIDSKLMEPTKGRGISQMADSRVMLMQNSKVCYACSSVSDPTCWKPDRRTTVKYCRVGHDSCITKTLRNANALIIIRDCAKSCDDAGDTGLMPRYKSCSVCHYDLCNGAFSVKIYNFMFISTIIVVFVHYNSFYF